MLKKTAVYGVIATAAIGFTLGSAPAQASTLPIVPAGTPLATYVDRLLSVKRVNATNVAALASRVIPPGLPIAIS
jgi:hypothetical protein